MLDAARARAAVARWCDLRASRHRAFAVALEAAMPGKDPWWIDGAETFREGTARYVEARFLIDGSVAVERLLADEPTFRHFAPSRGHSPPKLPGLSELTPTYFYANGMYLSFLLDVADPDWKRLLFDESDLLVGRACRATTPAQESERRSALRAKTSGTKVSL